MGVLGALLLAVPAAKAQTQSEEEKRKAEAAPQAVPLDTISIFADRNPRQVLDIPQTVTVIPQEEIEKRQVRDIQDLVRYEPGVTVSRQTSGTDPFGNITGFNIRGVGGNRVQMLIDGTRVIERITDGNRDFIDIDNMKAVEIIRGPASVLWGADALGGVVAFATKDPADYLKGRPFGGSVGVTFDSFDNSLRNSAFVASQFGQFQFLLGLSYRIGEEGKLSKARPDGGIWGCPRNPEAIRCNELNPLERRDLNFIGKIVWTPDAMNEVKFTGEYVRKHSTIDQRYDLGLTGTTYNISYLRDQEQTRYRATLAHTYTPNLGWLDRLRWQLSWSPQEREVTGTKLSRSTITSQVSRLEYLHDYKEQFYEGDLQLNSSFRFGGIENLLTYGLYANLTKTDYRRRDITTNLTTGVVTTVNAGGFNFANADTIRFDGYLQDEIKFFDGRLTITPGVRIAHYNLDPRPDPFYVVVPGSEPKQVETTKFLKQIGAVYKLNDWLSTYARYAEGFKMPTSEQLYTSLPSVGFNLIPNPNLRPEAVKSYELGLRGKLDKGFFSFGVFKSDYKDFIQSFVFQPNGIDITYENLTSVKLWGIEAFGEYQIYENIYANAALTYTRGTQRSTPTSVETPFDGASPFTAVLGLRYSNPVNGLSAEIVSTLASKVTRTASPTQYKPDGYAVFDLIVAWKPDWIKGLTLRASVLNFTDQRYFVWPIGSYSLSPSADVRRTNPLELQTAPGRTFRVGLNYEF